MAASLALPAGARPANLQIAAGVRVQAIDGDVLGICDRIAELSSNLFVVVLTSDDGYNFAIGEVDLAGEEHLLFRTKQLDGRVIEELERMAAIPLKDRLKEYEKREYKAEADRQEAELEALYEDMGRPMWTELERCGFIQRPTSYPKTGVTGGKGSRAKAARLTR